MSGRRSKKNQRLGSSRRGPRGLNRNIEKDDADDDDGFQQNAESGDGTNEFHTTSDFQSAQFDLPSSSTDQPTSVLECPPHVRSQKDSLMETELSEGKRKMGSTRKSAGGFKVERKLDELKTTEELDEYVSQPNISATEGQHSSLRGDEQSRSSSFPSNLSLHTESSGLGREHRETLMDLVSENEEKDAINHQELTSHLNEVVSATVSESDLLQEDPVMFNKLKPLSCQETPLASTTGQKRRMGSTRRPLGGKNSENVGVQEHPRSMTENERKAEVLDKVKFSMSEEMAQMWDDVLRDDPSTHTETSLVSNQSLLAERAELKELDVSAGTETMTQSVAFPFVNPEKPLPETSSHNETPLLNKGLDFKSGSHTEDFNVLKVLEDDNQHVPDTRIDTNTFHDSRHVNTADGKEEILMQKEEPPKNKTSCLSPIHESPSLSQHTAQLIEGGNINFDVPASNISHAEPTTTNSPHEMSDAGEQSREIYVQMKHKNNVCDVASITCDTLTDLECADEDERGSETDNRFEITDQDDARDHNVTQIIMESINNKEDGGMSTETVSHQEPYDVSNEKMLHREQEYSSTISQIQSGPPQDNAWKMLENKEIREDKGETENTIIIDVTSKSEEMLSFEDLATDTGSHAHQQLFMESLGKEGYDLSEKIENVAFDGKIGRSEETERIEGVDASLLILDTVYNDSESDLQTEHPDQKRVLIEEQNYTSPFQVSNTVSAVIDSSPLLHVALGSEETNTIAEESDISLVIPEDSQASYKLATFHSETQFNEGNAEVEPVGGDTDLEIQTDIKSFYSSTNDALGTEENSHDVSVLVGEFVINGDTVTVESNRTIKSDFPQTSSGALKVSENLENEVSSDINIIPEDSHREEGNIKLSPAVYKRKMGSTRRPLKGDTGQRKRREYDDEKEAFNSESMINAEKETFGLEYEPSPDESTLQRSKDGAKEQMEVCKKNDVGPAEGSASSLMQSSFSLDSVSEESTAVTISHITESQTLTKINQESQDNTRDAERMSAEGDTESHSEIQTENKTTDLTTSEAKTTEENIPDATVLVREVEFTVDTVTEESNMSEFNLLQNDTFTDAKLEALKVSENTENVSSVPETGLLVQDDVTEGSGEIDTIPDRNDTNIIPEDTHREEAHSKPNPIVHKRKMGSTRRPLKGNKGQRKGIKYDDENETLEPSPDESMLQSSKDGAKEQEMELGEQEAVGPESDIMQSSFSLDSASEESTKVTISHITESQTRTIMNQESQENSGDPERVPAEGDTESHSEIQTENKTFDLTSEAEGTEENICEATVMVREVFGDTVTVDSDMTIESDSHQNASSPDAHVEDLKVSENTENKVSGETDTITEPSDINIIPEDTHREEGNTKSSPVVYKRKMGSTRRPLRGDTGQRNRREYEDENETFHSESMINVEKETFSLEDEPSPDESTLQRSKDGAKEQMEICEKNYVGPAEVSESDIMQSSFSLDSVSEESTKVTISHITESQTLTKMNQESQKNSGDPERKPAEGDEESHSEIQIENKTIDLTSEAEGTEENICEATVIVREVIGDTVTVDSDMTIESDSHQNASSPDAHVEDLKVSENVKNKVSGETDTITEPSNINIIPEDSHREEGNTKSSPVVHKRKMGSTRRPLKGNKGQRKGIKYDDENVTLDSECMINVEKESLEDEPSADKSTSQSSKDGAKEQEMEVCKKNDVGPAEGSESSLMQSSFSLDSVSEETTKVTISHITESKTLTKIKQESQDNTRDAERVPAEGDTESHSEIQTENKTTDLTTSEAERTEENIPDATVLVREVEFTVDTVTVDSDTSESDLLQNDTFTDAKLEALKVSENTENVFSVPETGLLVQDDVTEGSRETDSITEPSDINIIPEDTHREEGNTKSSPVVYKRKMGSTRRPLKGNKGQRKGIKYDDENETLEPSPDESMLQSSKDGAKEQEMELCEKEDVGPESSLMQLSFSLDSVSEESTKVAISHITESQTLTKMNQESQDNTRDAERVPAEGDTESHSEIQTENKTTDLTTSEAERTEESIPDATVLVREVEFTVDAVTEESNMSEFNLLQNDTFTDAKLEALKVSENTENVSSVPETGLLVQDDVTEGSGEIDTIPDQNDTNIIPEDTHREEAHSKPNPIVHKRKMGSTRRPLKGNKGQRKGIKYDDENEKHHDEREIFVLEDDPSPDESSSQSSKDGAKEQMEICEKNDVGPAEVSESSLMQSSFSLDSVSEESTKVTISHITESQTLTKMNQDSQDNTGDAERVPAEGDTESHSEIQTENKTIDLTSEAERTEKNILDASVLVGEVEFTGDTVTEESNMSEFNLLQNDTFTDAKLEALKVSENTENVFSVPETGLLVQDDVTEGSGETDTIPDQNDTNIIPEDTHREEAHSKPNPIVHKRKMGSTRRPLKGNKGQRKGIKYYDENETLDSECMINVEKESLEDEPSADKSTSQSSKDGAEEQEMEVCKKSDVGPAEGSESSLMQSSFSLDSVSEESTKVTISQITKSQTLTKINQESQDNTRDAERVPAEGDTESHSEIQTENKTTDLTTSGAERTEENIPDATVLVREVEFTVDTVTVDSDMSESDLLQNDTFTDAKLEALKVSENNENVFSVPDTGLLVQDDVTEGSEETDTILDRNDTNIIPEDTHREEAHSKPNPIVHKRKMGSTRRPLKGNKGQRKGIKYDDENETLDSECMINVEKESLEDEPSADKSTSQSSKDGAKEQEMEVSKKSDVGPAKVSESSLMQSSFSLDSVSEESTKVTISHITESQTLTKIKQESQDNTRDAERVPAEGDTESHSEIQTENITTDLTTSEAERTEENIPDATVLVREVEFTVDTVTVDSDTSESDLLQNYTFTDAKLEALKVSENTENVSSVPDTGLLVQDDVSEGSGETDTILDRNDTNIIPEDTHREEAHSKPNPIVHKRKMGSTRRPLKGNKGQRKGITYDDENETLEPSPDESMLQSSKDAAKEQEMELCEKEDVGPESDIMQSSFSLDSVSEESTAVTISHITESQTLTKINQESQYNTRDAERMPAEGDEESHSVIQTENKTTNLTTSEAERTEENIPDATVLVGEVEFTVDTVTEESNMSEFNLLQNDTFTDAKLEALKVSENTENVSSVPETGLLVQDDVTEGSGETDTIPDQNDTNIIPEDTHREEAHSKPNPIVHKRKMGSTRRPLKGNKGQRKGIKYYDENETLDSECMINVEKESLEDEPSADKSTSQSSKDGAEEQEMEVCKKNDVGPAEGSESSLMQSSFSLDSVSEESTKVTISQITKSQTLTKIDQESQDNTRDAERVPAEGDTESHSEIQTENKTTDLTTSEAEITEENIPDATVLVREVEFTVDTVTVDSDTSESDLLQNDTFTDAKLEALKVSENTENVFSVPDTGLLVQDDVTEGSGETDTILDRNDTNIIPEDTHREEAHSKPNPIVHKRKMGSTRRPLKGKKGQRKGIKYDDENETLEPSPDESMLQSSKDGAKEQEMELCDIAHITESQTRTIMIQESQKNSGDPERKPAEGDEESHSEIQTENKTIDLTSEVEGTEENICEATVIVREVIGDTVTVDSDMTIESDSHQNASSPDAHVEDLKVSENVENKVSGETETITEPSNINIIPEVSHREEGNTKLSPVVHKRKMGSTRRPLRGDTGQRKRREYEDENETFSSESMINAEKETFGLEDEPSPDKSTSKSSKDTQMLTDVKLDSLKVSENTENVSFVTETGLLVQDDAIEVYSNVTTEADFHQNTSSPYAHVEELKSSENVENKVSGETDTITEPSDINIIPEDSHREEAHAKFSPVVHKRKMGSTRRTLRGNKGQRKREEDTETLSEIQDQDNVVGHNVTQEICDIRDDEDEERMTTTLVGMSMQLCDDLKHRSHVSQTQTGPSADDPGSLKVPERAADFVRDSLTCHSDLVLSDALTMEETEIHVSSEDVVIGDTWLPPIKVVEMHSVSNRSLQKRKMGSTRKRGKRMVNEEEVEEEKEGLAENTTIDDGTTMSGETLTLEEAITGSLVHQQAFQKSDVLTENSEQNYQNQAAEIVSDLPLGVAETYSVHEQSEIISIIPEESHRKDVQSNSIPVVQRRKMGSSRKTHKGQRREVESKKIDGESKEIAMEQDTDTHLAISEGENKWKLDEDIEQNFPVEFSYQATISNMFSESEDGVKEVSLNIYGPPEVSEERGLENTVNDSNILNQAINLNEGTMDKFVLTVSHEDVHQTMSAEYLDQHVHGGSETEQTENMSHVVPTQELKNTQDDIVHENNSQKIPRTKEKRRKMGSTRRNPQVMHGKDMGDQDDILGMAMERETKKEEDDLDDMPLASSISQPKEMSSEAVITTGLESEISVSATYLKGVENDYQNNSDASGTTGPVPPENTLHICENQLVSGDVTKHLQPETVTVEKRRKMGSTRKNVREGGIQGKRNAYEDTETADTHLTMSQHSEMTLVGKAVGEQTIHDQSEDSLLSEIERALNKTSQSSSNYELNVNEPNLVNTQLNKPENSEIKSLQPQPSQTSKTHSEPNSPERRRRKMGSTRRNPRQQLKAERQDEDKEDGEVEENSEGKKQEMKNLERVEVSVEHNIPENKLNKEHLNVPSAHTSSSHLDESGNPVVQESTSPSTKRKFGSRRTNKGKQGLGRLDASDRSELEDGVNDDLKVCDHSLQPENQPISKSISEQSNMEARNEKAAPKGTGAGLVSLDQIIKRDRSTGAINIQNRNSAEQFNVVMVGNSCVGKTSFIRRFHEGQFTEDYRSTIGVDTCMQTVVLPDRTVKLQIWDTAGQERFHSITRQVFHKADGLLLMYEISSSKSFISVRDWISQARERAPDDAIMILLGNKNDSVEREVQIQEGVDLAREYNIQFMECSAATGANVSESMTTLAELLVQRKTRREEHTTLRREPPPKKSGCC